MNKLWIINRHCTYSEISKNKPRPSWFSREKCYLNLTDSIKKCQNVDISHIVLFDGDSSQHFVTKIPSANKVINIAANSGAKSFIMSIEYALNNAGDDDIVYFLEDDYIHKEGWIDVLFEGMLMNPNGYISLYDHPDKYELPQYNNLTAQILSGKLSHWRTTPSTTDTFCIKKSTLQKAKDIMIKWSSLGLNYSRDHERCLDLWKNNIPLITPIPGYSTHCELGMLSPIKNWELI
jgi:hypothetical protein